MANIASSTNSPIDDSSNTNDGNFADLLNAEFEEDNQDDYSITDTHSHKSKRLRIEVPTDAILSKEEEVYCTHPGFVGGLCMNCGQKGDDNIIASAVPFDYIYKGLRLSKNEADRQRDLNLKNLLLHERKLYLVLDLDLTLLNTAQLLKPDEKYIMDQVDDLLKHNKIARTITKLRPFVHSFLEQASSLFEMYIYTMGTHDYANAMAHLLDPHNIYFNSRVICKDNSTRKGRKGLDVVLGQERAVLIIDDLAKVWENHKENLILMEPYLYFVSTVQKAGYKLKSYTQKKTDESHSEGALASILKFLKKIHSRFFMEYEADILEGDVRKVLKTAKKEVLEGCKVVFSRGADPQYLASLWNIAEELGAACSAEFDSSVTHVVIPSKIDEKGEATRWAVAEKKFLVRSRWLVMSQLLCQRQPEMKFSVGTKAEKQSDGLTNSTEHTLK